MADDPTPEPSPPPDKGADLTKSLEALLAKHGDSNSALRAVLADRDTLRDQLSEVRGKLPPDGALVLQGDDAKTWGAYQGLGKPSEIKQALADRDQFKTEADGFRRKDELASVATAANYKPSVFAKLADQDGLAFEIKDDKDKAGKPIKVVHVKGEGDKTTPLSEYAEAHWKEFLPVLKADATPPTIARGSAPSYNPAPPRPPVNPETPRRSLVR